MAAQPLRPDVAGPWHEFMLTGLAIGALPAVADRAAAEDQTEERYLVVEQAFHHM